MATAAPTSKAVIRLKEAEKVAVRLRITGGAVTADQLATIADIAARYSEGQVHLTTRQGVEIAPVHADDAAEVCAELAAAGIPLSATGPTVRGIVCCPSIACRNGVMDGQALARRLDAALSSFEGLHAKVKIAVAGCPNGCSKPSENDIGVLGVARVEMMQDDCTGCGACEQRCKVGAIAMVEGVAHLDHGMCIECGGCAMVCPSGAAAITDRGWRLLAGGKMGRFPRLGTVVEAWIDDEDGVIARATELLEHYRDVGAKGERLGDTMAREG